MKNDRLDILKDENDRLDILKDENGVLLLTDDQKQAVLERGKVLVSASAGSGKTSTMIKRIILLISEGVELKNLLVLVYNNAAADELKEKLHNELFKQACKSTGKLRERFASEIDNLPFCNICTIHSYCQTLIRENFDKLGISPTFEVLDENAHKVYMNKALDELFLRYSLSGEDDFEDLVEMFSQSRKDDEFRKIIINLFNLMEIHPTHDKFIECIKECYASFDNSKLLMIVMQYYKSVASRGKKDFERFEEIANFPKTEYIDNLMGATTVFDRVLNANTIQDMINAFKSYDDNKKTFVSLSKYDPETIDLGATIKTFVNQYMAVFEELLVYDGLYDNLRKLHYQNGRYAISLSRITLTFATILEQIKLKDNVLSFEDLQHYAMKLLMNAEDGQFNIFDGVLVDEYQDVNPLQDAIIQHLVKDECFVVGDVKQSIYGFRLADPTIFLSKQREYDEIDGAGTNIYFNQNFRSASGILQFVNEIFNSAMTRESADIDYKNEAQFRLDSKETVTSKHVQLHLFPESVKEKKPAQSGLYDITLHDQTRDEQASTREGRFIANKIRALVGKAIGTDEDGNGVYYSYGDIAILFRGRQKGAQEIVRVLKEEGIPINDSAFSKATSAPEQDIVTMLRVIDNPRQDIALAGYMLSFIGGFDEDELAKIASVNGESLYDKLINYAYASDIDKNKNIARKVEGMLSTLEEYRLSSSYLSVADLMNKIVKQYSFDAYLMRFGEAEGGNLKSTIASVKTLDMSLGEFLEYYDTQGDSSQTAGLGGGDRVIVSTFHGYKGLESPIVFVSDIAEGFNTRSGSGSLIMSSKGIGSDQINQNYAGLIGMYAVDTDKKTRIKNTISHLAVKKCIVENQIKEEIRLFYVALTRAKKQMFITASVSQTGLKQFGNLPTIPNAKCCLDFISNAKYEESTSIMPYIHYQEDCEIDAMQSNIVLPKPNAQLVDKIKEVMSFEYPYKEATKLSMKYSVSQLDSMDEQATKVYQEAANIGTAYHKVMQNIDYFADGIDGVKNEIERMFTESILTQEEKDYVDPAQIRACLDSDIIIKAREAELKGLCHREKAFMMYVKASDVIDTSSSDEKVLVQGVVDLIINGEEKYIVDFKNSKLEDENTLKKYKKQLYLYKKAVESALLVKIDKVLLYSFKTGKTIEM